MTRFAILSVFCWLPLLLAAAIGPSTVAGQGLLPSEFGDIELGRELIEPARFPTLRELRAAVAEPEVRFVLMMRLHGDEDPHHLPIWSPDGERLAIQLSRPERNESKLLLFPTMGTAQPTLLTNSSDAYDYLFQWAVNADPAFSFTRLEGASRRSVVLVAEQGLEPETRLGAGGSRASAALYRRTDGIWRLAFEQNGRLKHEAWSNEGEVQAALDIFDGTSPRWSRDGFRLLALRHVPNSDRVGDYEVAVRNLRTLEDRVVERLDGETIRSPCWSPPETEIAYFSRVGGNDAPWNIRRVQWDAAQSPRTVHRDVVVNPDFASQGPAWEPDGERIWCFSHAHREQAYYPLVAVGPHGGVPLVVHYPRRCTSPQDLALNPVTRIPEMAFVASVGSRRDVFIVFLNHY